MSDSNGNHVPDGAASALTVAMILDKSGSMLGVRHAVIEGYNDYLRELRDDAGETHFSLTMFDTGFRRVHVAEPLHAVPDLDPRTYLPEGMTALYDAIGHTVLATDRRLTAAGRSDDKVLVVVMTDGLENASTDYDASGVADLVREYEARGNWTFVYLGAGHDTIHEARSAARAMGYKDANAMRYEPSPAAFRKSMTSLAHATGLHRAAAERRTDTFFDDAAQSEADYREEPRRPRRPRTRPRPRPASKSIRRSSLGDALPPLHWDTDDDAAR